MREQLKEAGVDAPIFVVHGRMDPAKLSNTLEQALHSEGGVLISTALVGVGFDHASLHTLVVFDSHNW